MCGIAGVVSLDSRAPVSQEPVRRMLDAIAHRGPDDHGIYTEPGLVLGHRRLSILDLSPAAHQPMRVGSQVVTYNGEIYNHQTLRTELPARMYASSGDTETLSAALQHWGEAALQHLNGMFAFGWWNRRSRSFYLVRDRMGVKPLYYAIAGEQLVFCSELQGILASGLVDYEPDMQAVSDYLSLRFVPPPLTAVKGIFKLSAGHLLCLRRGQIDVRPWWRLPVADMDTPAPKYAAERFAELFGESVRMQMLSDVPVGVFLSGGLDSSAVAAEMADSNAPVQSFAVAFEGGGFYDERFYANLVSNRLHTEHHERVVTAAQFQSHITDVLGRLDEPITDLAALPLYFLSGDARRKVKVVLSGEGSDEILGGYNFNRLAFQFALRDAYQKIPKALRDGAAWLGPRSTRSWLRQQSLPLDRYPAMHGLYITGMFKPPEIGALIGPGFAPARRHIDAAYAQVAHADPLNQMLAVYAGAWLSEDLLMKADKMTMAHGLELRVPFLDYRLVEYLFSLPGPVKVSGPKTTGTKRLLRQSFAGRLPRPVLVRDKRGFPVPLDEWLRREPKWFSDILGSREGIGGAFHPPALQRWLREGQAGGPAARRVWNLTCLFLWDQAMRARQKPLAEAA